MRPATVAIAALGALILYELLRDKLARSIRDNTPVILRRELANRAASKAETPRRPTPDSKVKPPQPPARTEPVKQ